MKRRFKLQSLTSPILEWKYMCVCAFGWLGLKNPQYRVGVRAGWSWQTNEGVEIWRTPFLWLMLLRYHRNPHLVELGDNVLKWRQTKGAEIRREMRLRFCAAQTYFWYSMLYRSAATDEMGGREEGGSEWSATQTHGPTGAQRSNFWRAKLAVVFV